MIYLLLGGAAVLLLYASGALAAPRGPAPVVPPEGGPAPGTDGPLGRGPRDLFRRLNPLFLKYPSPMPPPALALICYRESGGRAGAIAYGKVSGASELGMFQLVVEHDSSNRPNMRSGVGAIGADVDPLDPVGALWGAQWVYARAKRLISERLAEKGFDVPPDTAVADWLSLMQADHSIGLGGVRMLIHRAAEQRNRTHAPEFITILKSWAETGESAFPRIGRQSPALVCRRVRRLLRLATEAAEIAPLPDRISPLRDRGPDVPRFNEARAVAALGAAARRA